VLDKTIRCGDGVRFELTCDGCGRVFTAAHGERCDLDVLRDRARAQGWTLSPGAPSWHCRCDRCAASTTPAGATASSGAVSAGTAAGAAKTCPDNGPPPAGTDARHAARRLAGRRAAVRSWDWLRGSSAGLQLLAVVVGIGAGLGAVAFRWMIVWATWLLSGHQDYAAVAGQANPHLPGLGRWFVVAAPVVAGLVYGPLVHAFAREARGHGVPEVMCAVVENGGQIRPRVAVVKAVASALCIGGGGSVGREGPIVQIGSALGSSLGQLVRLPESRLRLLVASGAAGGIAATFNAPVAGVFFALELILADFAVESFAAVVLAAVAASVIGRAFLGDHPFLTLPAFSITSPAQYLCYAVLGVLAAGVGIGFSRVLYLVEDLCDRLWRGPQWLRPAAGGLVLGGLLLGLPQMYGVGYPVLARAVRGDYLLAFVLLLLVGKIAATSLTLGIGGSGGVFAPSLFIGAMLGETVGLLLHQTTPQLAPTPGAYALVGMGAVFAGAARTPITAVIIMFELTGEYHIILPLMLAIAMAAGISKFISRDTIYTRKLLRRGIDLHAPGRALARLTVGAAAGPPPTPLTPEAGLTEIAHRFTTEPGTALPVVDDHHQLRGIVLADEVERALTNHPNFTAADLTRSVPVLHPDQGIDDALAALTHTHGSGVPVRSATGQLAAWITHRDLLRTAAGITRHDPYPTRPRRRQGADRTIHPHSSASHETTSIMRNS
jgi:CIC family chloride channel protein